MKISTIIGAGVCMVAASGLFASAASAQGKRLTLEPTSTWSLSEKPDRCEITRTFGEGQNATQIALQKGLGRADFNLVISGMPTEATFDQSIKFQFGPDEKQNFRVFVPGKTEEDQPALTVYGANFAPLTEDAEGIFKPDMVSADRLSAIRTLTIKFITSIPFVLNIGPMDGPAATLNQCLNEKFARYSAAHKEYLSYPEPTTSPAEWISSGEYPRELLFNRESAIVTFSLVVDDKGVPNFCEIMKSTRSQALRDLVCSRMLERARFRAARGKNGNPVPDTFTKNIRFQIK